ncbi:hypothetical protein MFIFM68171_10249 [Madurella fahalii]|uniref:non-specific serine/threonine protein kinase n=1 Tax=Madurella fahalii TaxID=1157608 RepID=A0ABQ0GQM2_9PEZI
MAQPKKFDVNKLKLDYSSFLSYTWRSEVGIKEAKFRDYVFFYSSDDDDHLDLGYVAFPKGFPKSFLDKIPEEGLLTLDNLEGVITIEQVTAAVRSIPDETVYVRLPLEWPVTVAGEPTTAAGLYLKGIDLSKCVDFLNGIAAGHNGTISTLRDEVQVLQLISQHPPHPNIVKYHGCRVRRGFITAIVMDRVDGETLWTYARAGGKVDKAPFMAALRSAITHLHSVVGVAHNDLNPNNIMVGKDGMPVLIDFGSARQLGGKIGFSVGTPGWMEDLTCARDYYSYSKASHDLTALDKISDWLDDPVIPSFDNHQASAARYAENVMAEEES